MELVFRAGCMVNRAVDAAANAAATIAAVAGPLLCLYIANSY